jgi:hypothetical protein
MKKDEKLLSTFPLSFSVSVVASKWILIRECQRFKYDLKDE